ncbi:MAG: hypothetical protein HYU64_13805 [Armatimonadetes bacterium]|nr:hypothetical protein [Armatimonadota bacterium]
MVVFVFEILFYVIFISLGILAGYATAKETDEFLKILNPGARLSSIVSMALIGGLIGAWIAPRFSKLFFMVANWLIGSVRKTPRHQFISGAVGFIIGLLIATLLDIPLLSIPFSTLIPNVGQFVGPHSLFHGSESGGRRRHKAPGH